MTIENLKCFITLAKELNYTKAAELCHTSQTSMSRKILSMEKEIGFDLFIRNHHKVELTEAGNEFYLQIENLVNQYEQALTRIQFMNYHLSSTLSIGVGIYEHTLVQAVLSEFLNLHYVGKLNMEQYSYRQLIERLLDNQLDLILTSDQYLNEYNLDNLTSRLIHNKPWRLLIHKDNPLSREEIITTDMLDDQNLVTMDQGPVISVLKLLEKNNINPVSIDYVNSHNTKMMLINANRGVGFVPDFADTSACSNACSKYLTPAYRPRSFYAVYRTNNPNPLVHSFVELLNSRLSADNIVDT